MDRSGKGNFKLLLAFFGIFALVWYASDLLLYWLLGYDLKVLLVFSTVLLFFIFSYMFIKLR